MISPSPHPLCEWVLALEDLVSFLLNLPNLFKARLLSFYPSELKEDEPAAEEEEDAEGRMRCRSRRTMSRKSDPKLRVPLFL